MGMNRRTWLRLRLWLWWAYRFYWRRHDLLCFYMHTQGRLANSDLVAVVQVYLWIVMACALFGRFVFSPATIFLSIDIGAIATTQVTDTRIGRIDLHKEVITRNFCIVKDADMSIVHAA